MNTQLARQKWFQCFGPDALLSRAEAVRLIHKHSTRALLTDLSDAQVRAELPTAWVREHQQADMFRDASAFVANDDYYRPRSVAPTHVWDTLKDFFGALVR